MSKNTIPTTADVIGASRTVTGGFVQCSDQPGHGPGVPGVLVALIGETSSTAGHRWTAVSGPDGRFSLPDLPVGYYHLTFQPPAGYREFGMPRDGSQSVWVNASTPRLHGVPDDLELTRARFPTMCEERSTLSTKPSRPNVLVRGVRRLGR